MPDRPATARPLLRTRPILERMRAIEGWLSDEEGDLLIAAAVRALDARRADRPAIVEVGSYCGRSTTVLASVDPQPRARRPGLRDRPARRPGRRVDVRTPREPADARDASARRSPRAGWRGGRATSIQQRPMKSTGTVRSACCSSTGCTTTRTSPAISGISSGGWNRGPTSPSTTTPDTTPAWSPSWTNCSPGPMARRSTAPAA